MAHDGARHVSQTSHVETTRLLLVVSHEVFDRCRSDAPNPRHAHRVRMVQIHGPEAVMRGRSPHRLSRLNAKKCTMSRPVPFEPHKGV
eukprot:1259436-Pleurochrysis_carterae.AAC.1